MTYLSKVKRAMFDKNLYNGSTLDNEWGLRETLAYQSFCDKFGGHYSVEPSPVHQSPEFLKLVDSYEDLDYSKRDVVEGEQPKNNGQDLRQYIPERQPVNTEVFAKEEVKSVDKVLNENAVRLSKPPTETAPVKEIKEVTVNDAGAESSENDSKNGENTPDDKSGSGQDSGATASKTDGATPEPARKVEPKPVNRPPQNVNRSGSVKTR